MESSRSLSRVSAAQWCTKYDHGEDDERVRVDGVIREMKEKKEGVITELLDVVWQVGKSGVVSPVAILKPVEVGDALVSRATLHNIEYIRSLNLEIGCSIEVIRSGEIIPRIVRRVDIEKNSS